jgi:lysozyme family protein
MCDERMAFLRGLAIWPRFRGGWSTRVADLRSYCTALADDKPVPPAHDIIADHVASVKTAQREYNQLYDLHLDIDGFEGPETKRVTRRFQEQFGLEVDGIVGEHTMAKLAEVVPPVPGVLSLFDDTGPEVMAKGVENVSDIHLEYEHDE